MSTQELTADILPTNPIRIETALSRYPVHRLAKQGDITIDIRRMDEHGEEVIRWDVSYNSKHGQPGPLAYKLDTLIINRRIEEAPRPIPTAVRIGSLREVYDELSPGHTGNTNVIKAAFHQNASAYITAKIDYRAKDGRQRTIEISDTRYGVVFTGEKLPDGRKADAVYIVLHPFYKEILDNVLTRPIDYDYLRILPPASQRFYELLSYQMYAALKNDRPRAKLLYSELCTYAPLARQTDWNVVRPQLARIHAPHKKYGYVCKIDFQDTVDNQGRPDWIMLYQPGPKARAEYRAFTKRGGPVMLEAGPLTADPLPQLAAPALEPSPLAAELIRRGITPAVAVALAQEHDEEAIRAQIDYLDWQTEHRPKKKIGDPAAYLATAIRNGHAAPKGYTSPAQRAAQAEAKRQAEARAAEAKRREQADAARHRKRLREEDAYWQSLSAAEQTRLDAEAMAAAEAAARDTYESMKRMGSGDGYFSAYIRQMLDNRQPADA